MTESPTPADSNTEPVCEDVIVRDVSATVTEYEIVEPVFVPSEMVTVTAYTLLVSESAGFS